MWIIKVYSKVKIISKLRTEYFYRNLSKAAWECNLSKNIQYKWGFKIKSSNYWRIPITYVSLWKISNKVCFFQIKNWIVSRYLISQLSKSNIVLKRTSTSYLSVSWQFWFSDKKSLAELLAFFEFRNARNRNAYLNAWPKIWVSYVILVVAH